MEELKKTQLTRQEFEERLQRPYEDWYSSGRIAIDVYRDQKDALAALALSHIWETTRFLSLTSPDTYEWKIKAQQVWYALIEEKFPDLCEFPIEDENGEAEWLIDSLHVELILCKIRQAVMEAAYDVV